MRNLKTSVITTIALLAFFLLSFLSPAPSQAATDYYVSKSGTNQDGLSWNSAWNEMDQINWSQIVPGDTIYLDGGVTSMTYTTTLAPTVSGTATSPITIRLSSEVGRSGKAIINGGRLAPLPECGQNSYAPYANAAAVNQLDRGIGIFGVSYITIDGTKWGGIEVTRSGHGIRYGGNAHHTTIRNLEIHDNGSINQDNDGSVNNLWYSGSPGIRVEGSFHTFERLNIHDNGQDNIQSGGTLSELTSMTVRESWLHNQRIHSGADHSPSGDSPDELGAPQQGPDYNGFVESFNWCTHSDAVQVFNGGGNEVRNFLFENSIFGPGHTNTFILGDTSGGGATVTYLTMKNVLVVKGSDNNINGKAGPNDHDNWNLQNITVYSPNIKFNGIRLFGRNHHITNSVFYGGNAFFETALATDTGNCVFGMTGNSFGSTFGDPLFTTASSDPFSLDDYSLRAGSPCLGKGSAITSVAQLLSIVGSGDPTPSPSPSPSVSPSPNPTCPEDINEDRIVDLFDYSLLANDFFKATPTNPRSNIDGVGIVDLFDYSLLVARFLEPC